MKNGYYFMIVQNQNKNCFGLGNTIEGAIKNAITVCGRSVIRDKNMSIYKTNIETILDLDNIVNGSAENIVISLNDGTNDYVLFKIGLSAYVNITNIENNCEYICSLQRHISDNFKKYFKHLI
jgi:hypothetical protein